MCNGAVNFVIKHDHKGVFQFASLQSQYAQQRLQQHGDFKKLDSFILLQNNKLFQKSTAALRVARYLPWYWQWLQVFWIVPRSLRDGVYTFIANNRYKWFGKKDACMIPGPGIRSRFIEL